MKKYKYVDLHCHPFVEYFKKPEDVVKGAKAVGIDKLFVVGTDLKNSLEAINLCEKFNYTFAIIGIHPNSAWDINLVNQLENMINNNVFGIGEIGLDYHYEYSPIKEIQKEVFVKQIELANKYNLPVVVHSRDAHEDTYNIIKKYKNKYPKMNFILHSYSSGIEYVKKYVELGVYFSFSGIVTFKNAKEIQEASKLVPLNLIFCETDTPYLTPVPYRGKTNLPNYVIEITNFISNLKNINIDELLKNINDNVTRVFFSDKEN